MKCNNCGHKLSLEPIDMKGNLKWFHYNGIWLDTPCDKKGCKCRKPEPLIKRRGSEKR